VKCIQQFLLLKGFKIQLKTINKIICELLKGFKIQLKTINKIICEHE
jgi:hypothetical protein